MALALAPVAASITLLLMFQGWCIGRSNAEFQGSSDSGWQESARNPAKVGRDLDTVRILVVGKTGAGKSTLIRRLFQLTNKDGKESESGLPKSSTGKPGFQYINKVWKLPRHTVFIHDSNGVSSTSGGTEVLAKFLKDRMSSGSHHERVHLVWYVMSALESRISDEANLLQEVTRSLKNYSVPVLLVVTHCDGSQQDYHYFFLTNIERNLDAFLEPVEPKTRDAIKSNVVKVGNQERPTAHAEEGGPADTHKFAVLAKTVLLYLGSDAQRQTWVSAQKVDFKLKLERTSEVIHNFTSGLLRNLASYVMDKLSFASSSGNFKHALRELCSVWDVPRAFENGLREEFLFKDSSAFEDSSSEFKAWSAAYARQDDFQIADFTSRARLVELFRAIISVYNGGSVTYLYTFVSHLIAAVASGADGHSVEQANSMLMLAGSILFVKGSKDPGSAWTERSQEEYRGLIGTFFKRYSVEVTLLQKRYRSEGCGVEPQPDVAPFLVDLILNQSILAIDMHKPYEH